MNIRHVLVPLDGSEFALRAVPTARVLARRFGAELHTVSVAVRDDDSTRLRKMASAALGVADGDERALVVTGGDPAEVIAERAKALGSCVVCLTTHGRGRVVGAFMGSVARSLVQRSTDPVVALGPMADNPGWSPRPRNWPEPLSVPRIVACVDGSDASEMVLPAAAAWAQALEMSLSIVTIIDDVPPPIRPEQHVRQYPRHDSPAAYIEGLVQQWGRSVTEINGEVLRDPLGPASGLRAHLYDRPAGLVALATHARSGMQRFLLGAQAADIVHASVAPCLVVPASTHA